MPTPDTTIPSIQSVTPTLCALFDVDPPEYCAVDPLDDVIGAAKQTFDGVQPERCLVFAPDAMGCHLHSHIPEAFEVIREITSIEVPLRSVIPSKTPVCFSSMFTGAPPEVHGIRQYEKPVLRKDTIFDAFLRAGKRIAIAAVEGSSIERIFRERGMDYFSEPYDPEVIQRADALMREDEHDLIVAYLQEYDDTLHRTTPDCPEALQAARNHVDAFEKLTAAAHAHWKARPHVICFVPDHGAHLVPETGHGNHGEDIPADMDLCHYYTFREKYA